MSNFQQRLLLGSLTAVFSILCIWFSPSPAFRPFFTLIIASLITIAALEFYHMAQGKGYQPLIKIGLTGCFLYVLAIYATTQHHDLDPFPYVILIGTLFSSFIYLFRTGKDPLINLSLTFFAFIYLVIPLSTWLNIVYFFPESSAQEGRWWLFYLLSVTKLTDVGAYFVGSSIGQHKMTPTISPGKTWEGGLGGLLFGVLTSCLFYLFIPWIPIQLSFPQALWLGILLSFMGQIGDLAESLLKRDVGLKNSSDLPGLGGGLDVFDSLVFTSPLLYYFLKVQN